MKTKIEFEELLSSATTAWNRRDYEGAVAILDKIPSSAPAKWKSQGLYLSGLIKRDAGNKYGSLRDLEKGLDLSGEESFLRYCFQVAIADHFESIEDNRNALLWYREAIRSNVRGNGFSASAALSNFLRLSRSSIPRPDLDMVEKALVKSWKVLGLSGHPELDEIENSIAKLESGISDQFDEIVNG